MDEFIYFLAAGVCSGAIIGLIALGYSLVYGIIKLINFAHGEFYMVGAYAGFGLYYYVLRDTTLSPWLAIPLITLVSGLAGALIAALTEWVAYKPIRGCGRLSALLTAIGVSFLLQNIFSFIDNGNPQTFTGSVGDFCQSSVTVGSGGIKTIKIVYIFVGALLTLGLWVIVMKTRFGRAMRAVSEDADAAALMGVNTDSVIRRTFILGGFLAGVAGALVGVQSVVEPMMGFMPGLKAFVAAVAGGIGSIPGAVLGGLLIGVIENMVVWAGIPTGYKDVACFVVLILVLVIRPQGLLGSTRREKV